MRETNRRKLYDYCEQYVRTMNTRQDIIFHDPKADLNIIDKLNSKIEHLENNIKSTINEEDE